jgi:hypothetical protein
LKNVFTFLLAFTFLNVYAQESAFDGHTWQAPYHLPIPKDWGVERFPVPPSFATSIPFTGVEDIRFMPGWSKMESNEYWSYAFLWYLNGAQKPDAKNLQKDLTAYYTGLFKVNTDPSKIDTTQLVPVKVSIQTKKTDQGDHSTFEGIVVMNDYMTKKPISLNLVVHIKSCEAKNNSFVFFELSPKPVGDAVWKSLDQLWIDFKCIK